MVLKTTLLAVIVLVATTLMAPCHAKMALVHGEMTADRALEDLEPGSYMLSAANDFSYVAQARVCGDGNNRAVCGVAVHCRTLESAIEAQLSTTGLTLTSGGRQVRVPVRSSQFTGRVRIDRPVSDAYAVRCENGVRVAIAVGSSGMDVTVHVPNTLSQDAVIHGVLSKDQTPAAWRVDGFQSLFSKS